MSKMNLQKLRQVCHRDEYDRPSMKISLFANPLSRVVFEDAEGMRRTAQLDNISSHYGFPEMSVSYRTDEDFTNFDERKMIDFNSKLARAFLPRLNQILVENGFHEKYLPIRDDLSEVPFILLYPSTPEIKGQILHACYTDGRSMRAAVEYQAELNKT